MQTWAAVKLDCETLRFNDSWRSWRKRFQPDELNWNSFLKTPLEEMHQAGGFTVYPLCSWLFLPLWANWELQWTNKTSKQKKIFFQFPLRIQFLCFRPVDRLCVRSPGERTAAKEPSVINRAQFSSLSMCLCVCYRPTLAGFPWACFKAVLWMETLKVFSTKLNRELSHKRFDA